MNGELTVFGIPRVTSTSSGFCGGDSGSGPYNTTMIPGGLNLTMGVASSNPVQVPGTGRCVAVGASTLHSIPDASFITNLVTFFNGSCTTLTTSAGDPFVRCWSP
jgi:hypothetical protein